MTADFSHVSIKKIKTCLFLSVSVLFAFLLTLLPNEYFRDRENYIVYARESLSVMEQYDGIGLFTNEPLFLWLNHVFSFVFDERSVPLVFVFFVGFTVSYFIFVRSRNALLAVLGFFALILVPQSFHMLLVVLRQAFTAALLMWIIYYFWRSKFFFDFGLFTWLYSLVCIYCFCFFSYG